MIHAVSTRRMAFQWIVPRILCVTSLLSVVVGLASVPAYAAGAPPSLAVSNTTKHAAGTDPSVVAPTLTIVDDDNEMLDGAQVALTTGFTPDTDRLGIRGQDTATSGMVSGLAWSYNQTVGILTFSGTAPVADYQAVLRQVTFYTVGEPALLARSVHFTLGSALANPVNGHFYTFISQPDIPWNTARDSAASSTFFGMQGYLVTITSEAETNFMSSKLPWRTWIGASDADVEGEWRWVTGPEAGIQFWSGTYDTGGPVNHQYNHWLNTEPNNWMDEDYAYILDVGFWNDLQLPNPGKSTSPTGYIVEYGGMSSDPVLQITGTATVTVVQNLIYLPMVNAPSSSIGSVIR